MFVAFRLLYVYKPVPCGAWGTLKNKANEKANHPRSTVCTPFCVLQKKPKLSVCPY